MISVIIPHYPFSPAIEEKLKTCISTLSGVDELIIVANEGTGFAKNVNIGLRVARGEYLMVLNNDVFFTHGRIPDLCVPDTVTFPKLNFTEVKFNGACFCLPRNVYQRIGGLDEQFEIGYFEDDDYLMRLNQAAIPLKCVTSVNIETLGGDTMKQFDNKQIFEINKKKFEAKWPALQLSQ